MSKDLGSLYPAHLKTLQKRHEKALRESEYDRLIIFGGAERMAFLDDNPYPFRVNPHFKSWVPVLGNPNCVLVVKPGEKPLLLYYLPVDYWHKPAGVPEGYWVEHFDIRQIGSLEEAPPIIASNGGKTAMIGEPEALEGKIEADNNPQALVDRLHYDRAWKTEYEIECMRRANAVGVRGHLAAEKAFRSGASEYEIHLEYLRATEHNEAQLPYGNIIALNENAAVLHYQHQERQRVGKEALHSFLIDAGATFNGYASDITRTYSSRNDEFQELVDAMDEAQQEIVAAVKPGLDYRELHLLAHRRIGELLARFGLVTMGVEEMVERKVTGKFLPHGLGHYIGLQVHDVGGFMGSAEGETIPKPEGHPNLRLTRRIEAKQVFTIEPGLYFIESLLDELRDSDEGKSVNWDRVNGFRKYGGIRIEDDIAVTVDGFENLTRDQFAGLS